MYDFFDPFSQSELLCVRKGLGISDDDICRFSGNKGRGGLDECKHKVLVKVVEWQTFEKVEALILSNDAKVLSMEVSAPAKI